MSDENQDQADILGLNEQLNTQVANLTASLNSTKTLLTAAQTEVSDLKAQLKTANDSVTALTSERDALKASQKDFDGRVAAELAKKGISGKAVDAPAEGGGKQQNLTEQCMAAKGINSK